MEAEQIIKDLIKNHCSFYIQDVEDTDRIISEYTDIIISFAKDKCKEQRQLCNDEICDESDIELQKTIVAIRELVLDAPEPEFKNILAPTQ